MLSECYSPLESNYSTLFKKISFNFTSANSSFIYQVHPRIRVSFYSIYGPEIIEKMNAMSQLHYDLKITTVTGIPMKVSQIFYLYTIVL